MGWDASRNVPAITIQAESKQSQIRKEQWGALCPLRPFPSLRFMVAAFIRSRVWGESGEANEAQRCPKVQLENCWIPNQGCPQCSSPGAPNSRWGHAQVSGSFFVIFGKGCCHSLHPPPLWWETSVLRREQIGLGVCWKGSKWERTPVRVLLATQACESLSTLGAGDAPNFPALPSIF